MTDMEELLLIAFSLFADLDDGEWLLHICVNKVTVLVHTCTMQANRYTIYIFTRFSVDGNTFINHEKMPI